VKALEAGVGIHCVFAVATERIWQQLVCQAMNNVQLCDAYSEIRSTVLEKSRPTVEDILDHASYLDILMGAAEMQGTQFEMPALECWKECRSIIADAQGVTTVHSRLQLLLIFIRQVCACHGASHYEFFITLNNIGIHHLHLSTASRIRESVNQT
jgi:hypothetical protein